MERKSDHGRRGAFAQLRRLKPHFWALWNNYHFDIDHQPWPLITHTAFYLKVLHRITSAVEKSRMVDVVFQRQWRQSGRSSQLAVLAQRKRDFQSESKHRNTIPCIRTGFLSQVHKHSFLK